MASNENIQEVLYEDSIDHSDDDNSELETISESKLFKITSFMGTGKRLKVNSARIYEWDEVVEIIEKFVEMVESYPGMVRSMESEHMDRVWKKWTTTNYEDLNSITTYVMVTPSYLDEDDILQISLEQFHDIGEDPAFQDQIIFHIFKKNRLKSLKEIAIEAVVDNLQNPRDADELKLPSSLTLEVKREMSSYCEKFPVPSLKDLAATAVVDTLDSVEDVAKLDLSIDLHLDLIRTGYLTEKFPAEYLDLLNDSHSDSYSYEDEEEYLYEESEEDSDNIYIFDARKLDLSSDGSYDGFYNSDF